MDKDTKQAYDWAKGTNYHSVAADYARCLALELDRIAAERDRFKARAEAAVKERDALIAAIRDKDACRTCVHCLKDGCSAVRNGWRCRYVHPSKSGPQEGANQ